MNSSELNVNQSAIYLGEYLPLIIDAYCSDLRVGGINVDLYEKITCIYRHLKD